MNEIKKMFCPSCGAPISFQPGREDTFCSHCGAQLYFQDDHLEVKLKHEEAKMKHEEVILEYKDREEQRKKAVRDDKIVLIIMAIGAIFALALWVLLFNLPI